MEHPKADRVPVDTVWVVTMRTWVFQFPKHISPSFSFYQHDPRPPSLDVKMEERESERGEPAFTEHLLYWVTIAQLLFWTHSLHSPHNHCFLCFQTKKRKKKNNWYWMFSWLPWSHRTRCFVPMPSDSEAYILLSEIGVRRVLQVSSAYPCSEASYMISPSEVYSSALSPPWTNQPSQMTAASLCIKLFSSTTSCLWRANQCIKSSPETSDISETCWL